MMAIELPPQISRVDQIAKLLAEEIKKGMFRAGDRLPTAQDLTVRFGVSRSVIREAIAVLRADGLVVSRQGAGVFVAQLSAGRPFHIDPAQVGSVAEILQVMQLRRGVEVEAAGCAAEARSATGIAEIGRALERIDAAIEAGENAADADFAFHLSIADATGNPYFGQFIRFLGTLLIPRQTLRQRFPNPEALRTYLLGVQEEHRALHAAIQDGEASVARRLMHAHLEASMQRYRLIIARER